jgi:hypothetical protein
MGRLIPQPLGKRLPSDAPSARCPPQDKPVNPTDNIKNDGDAFWDLDVDENVLQDVEREVSSQGS